MLVRPLIAVAGAAWQVVGFRVIERYRDATDDWAILAWDWTAATSPASR